MISQIRRIFCKHEYDLKTIKNGFGQDQIVLYCRKCNDMKIVEDKCCHKYEFQSSYENPRPIMKYYHGDKAFTELHRCTICGDIKKINID